MKDIQDEMEIDLTDLIFDDKYYQQKKKVNLDKKLNPNLNNVKIVPLKEHKKAREIEERSEVITKYKKSLNKNQNKEVNTGRGKGVITNTTKTILEIEKETIFKKLDYGKAFENVIDEEILKKPKLAIGDDDFMAPFTNQEFKELKNEKIENKSEKIENKIEIEINNSNNFYDKRKFNNLKNDYKSNTKFNTKGQGMLNYLYNLSKSKNKESGSNYKNDNKDYSRNEIKNNENLINNNKDYLHNSNSNREDKHNKHDNHNKHSHSSHKSNNKSNSNSIYKYNNPHNETKDFVELTQKEKEYSTSNVHHSAQKSKNEKNSNNKSNLLESLITTQITTQSSNVNVVAVKKTFSQNRKTDPIFLQELESFKKKLSFIFYPSNSNTDLNNNNILYNKYKDPSLNPFLKFYKSSFEDTQLYRHVYIDPRLRLNFLKKFPLYKNLITKDTLFTIVNNKVDKIYGKIEVNVESFWNDSIKPLHKFLFYVKLIKNSESSYNFTKVFVTENLLKTKLNICDLNEMPEVEFLNEFNLDLCV